MIKGKYEEYTKDTLKPFAEKLLAEYYNTLETLCESGYQQAEKVRNVETETIASEYAQKCCEMIGEIRLHIRTRKEKFIPYIHQLVGKVEASHDCSTCSGGCKLTHDMQVWEMNASNEAVKKTLNRMQLATLPLYSQTMFPDDYRILRNRMALIEMNMTELFFLENTYLVPKIVEAQKAINAGNK